MIEYDEYLNMVEYLLLWYVNDFCLIQINYLIYE